MMNAARPDWPASAAVVLVNLGTPSQPTPAAVGRFLAEFLSDRRVVELPPLLWQPILRGIVIPLRAKRVAHAYGEIWGTDSPLRAISERQQMALQARLREHGGDAAPWVRLAMSYQGPTIADVMRECLAAAIERIVVLPLYPQYSATTTAAVFDQVSRCLLRERCLPHLTLIRDYHDAATYIDALAQSVRAHWHRHGRGDHLLLSFHGIPERNVARGDPYADQCQRSATLLAKALALDDSQWSLAYQSRFGRAKWLAPYTDATLMRLAKIGMRKLDVLCPAFAADCLETLEEMKLRNRDLYLQSGGAEYRLIECLNDSAAHIAMMEALVSAALPRSARNTQGESAC
jgi:protoporphyrin/coproporphyrin ferrochelatase